MAKEIPVEALEAYKNGESVVSIARRLKIGTNRFAGELKKAGILRSSREAKKLGWTKLSSGQRDARVATFGKRKGKEIDSSTVLSLFEAGKGFSLIAYELKVGSRRVKKILIDLGKLSETHIGSCAICAGSLGETHKAVKYCLTCAPDSRFGNLCSKYGVSKPIWDRMLESQGGHCFLCERPAKYVDHDHTTDVVRGLLCGGCNVALGQIDRDPSWTERALEYSKRGKSEAFGS